jgi:RimJ/RimL family protein N-acetyltransferase
MAVAETMRKIRAHWRAQLGCDVDALPRGVTVIAHAAALVAYSGVYAVMREGRCAVSAPAWIVDGAHDALAGRAAADVFDARAIAVPFGDAVERVIGPAWIGYADAADVRARDRRDARLLIPDDDAALRTLAAAAGETAWEHSGIDFDRAPIFGLFVNRVLAAACSYERRGEHVLHVGVVTHPAHRGRGYGRAVASAATAHGLAAGGIMQWQTLVANAPSLAIGRSLGYREYCRTLAVRLRDDAHHVVAGDA